MSDDRLRDALRGAAREPSLDGVAERVHAKWSRRRTVRRVERAALAGALLVGLVVAGVVVLDRTGGDQQVTAPPARGSVPVVRVADATGVHRVSVKRVHVTADEGYVRGPLVASADHIAMAGYNREGTSFTFPPSRIVRVDAIGAVFDRVDLKGEIISLADGEGARWALTRDKTVLGPNDPEFRVKRIGPDGSIASNPVPPGEQPVGRIVAGGGGVWVPVRDGVLRFDSVTGAFAAKIALSTTTDRREVAPLGKSVSVTDGADVKRLDPFTDAVVGTGGFGEPVAVPRGYEYVDLVGGSIGDLGGGPSVASALARNSTSGRWLIDLVGVNGRARQAILPKGLEPERLQFGGTITWVIGRLHGSLAVLEFNGGDTRIRRTIKLANIHDADVVFVSDRQLLATSGGSLYRLRLPK